MATTIYVAHIDGLGDNDWQEIHATEAEAWGAARNFLEELWAEDFEGQGDEALIQAVEESGGFLSVNGHDLPNLTTIPNNLDPDALVVVNEADNIPGAQTEDGVTAVALIDLARHIVDQYNFGGEVVYIAPSRNDDGTTNPARLVCPDPTCLSEWIVQVDVASRWNEYDEAVTDRNVIVWSTGGDGGDFHTDHYLCATCGTKLAAPDGVNAPRTDPNHIEEEYT